MSHRLFRKSLAGFSLVLILILSSMGCAHTQGHHAKTSQHRFDDIEFWVKMFEDPARDAWQKPAEVVEAMNLDQGDTVADIGAGTGYFTRRFAVAVGPAGKAIGLDIEQSMVTYMKDDAKKLKIHNYDARVVKFDDPELAPHSVDVVFLCNTYHHIENRAAYFRNVTGALKANGRVVIVDFYKDSSIGPPRDHKLAKAIVLEEMRKAGYRMMKSHTFLEQQYFLEFGL